MELKEKATKVAAEAKAKAKAEAKPKAKTEHLKSKKNPLCVGADSGAGYVQVWRHRPREYSQNHIQGGWQQAEGHCHGQGVGPEAVEEGMS